MTHATVFIDHETTHITVFADDGQAIDYVVPCGMSSLHRRHFTADPPLPEDLTNAIGEMVDHLDDARRELPLLDDASVVVLTGTSARAVAAVEFGGEIHQSTFDLSRDAAEDVFRTLATESTAERRHNPGLPSQLAETIVGGCCAIVALFRVLKLGSATVAVDAHSNGLPR
jgi:exopolyphosphatase/guanosine-5'-triphosphate,3'-diphosphate pyrophosphatase